MNFQKINGQLTWTLLDSNFKFGFIYLKTTLQCKFMQLCPSKTEYSFTLCENELAEKFVVLLKVKDKELTIDCSGSSPCSGCSIELLDLDLSGVPEAFSLSVLPLVVFDSSFQSIYPEGVSYESDLPFGDEINVNFKENLTIRYPENVSQLCIVPFQFDSSSVRLTLDVSGCRPDSFIINRPQSLEDLKMICIQSCSRNISSVVLSAANAGEAISCLLLYCLPELV